jgi:hypothetical protein
MGDGPVAVLLPDDLPAACGLIPAALRLRAAGREVRISGPAWAADLLAGSGAALMSAADARRGATAVLGHGVAAALAARLRGIPGFGGGGWVARRLWRGPADEVIRGLPDPPQLPADPRHDAEVAAALEGAGIRGPFTVLSPRVLAGRTGREGVWPAYPLLHRLLREGGRRVVLLPGGGDPAAIQALVPDGVMVPGLGAGATAALLLRAVSSVTDDEGIAHLGALTGAPVVVLARRPLPELAGRVTLLAGDRWPTAAQVWSAMERPR